MNIEIRLLLLEAIVSFSGHVYKFFKFISLVFLYFFWLYTQRKFLLISFWFRSLNWCKSSRKSCNILQSLNTKYYLFSHTECIKIFHFDNTGCIDNHPVCGFPIKIEAVKHNIFKIFKNNYAVYFNLSPHMHN